jgi:hypothetical protein
MCSTTLGAGVTPPFEDLYAQAGMIFASAVSDDFKTMMRRAAFEFNRASAATETELRRRVRQLETDLAMDTPGAHRQLEDARAEAEAIRYPYCHDHSATKDLILDMVFKSRHGHVAVLDDQGFRLSISMKNGPAFARESIMLPLTTSYMMDQASIRIHGTGESKNRFVTAGKSATFMYFSSPSPGMSEKLISKLAKSTMLTPLKGHSVIIPDAPLNKISLQVSADGLLKLLNTYYMNGHKPDDEKATYVIESQQLTEEWQQFLSAYSWMDTLGIPDSRRQRADLVASKFHIKPKVAAAFAARAAMCQAVIDNTTDNHMKIPLTRRHLQLAIEFFKVLFRALEVRLKAADKQADNAAKARAARATPIPSPARQEDAMEVLRDAIVGSGKNMISRDTARRLPKVTVALLDYLAVNNDDLVELVGTEQIKMGKTSRAYTLRSLISHDLQEAKDELSDATMAYAVDPHDPAFDDMQIVRHEIMRLAADAEKGDYGLPAVPITKMSPKQLRCLPAILNEFTDCFVLRGTPENPELPHLVKTVTDPTAPLDPDVPVVWVRRNVEGRDFRDWTMAARLGFSEIWKP